MPLALLSLIVATQGIPARAVVMEATLGDKPYGTVVYTRGIVPGKGMERSVTLTVKGEAGEYTIVEKRTYATGGAPTLIERTYSEGERKVVVKVTFNGNKAIVSVAEGQESETDEFPLTVEGASINDPSQFWFFGSPPKEKTEVKFWEYSLDENAWVERKVKYEGTASLKVNDQTVTAHRISIGDNVNFYVDDAGMPYKSVQKTANGELVLLRTKPEVGS